MNPSTPWNSSQTTRELVSPFGRARRRRYVDGLIDDYVTWREACGAVAVTYEGWLAAGREDREIAFNVYSAALDREEDAARAYQVAVAQVAAA
ncbi:MAG TPA: hypothetical protein VG275_05145 [Solirubrobacteraceae bacterium]|jgi:hypothetical protein|nr:hypothetical protein [Solirubrobacteraceae bacterium]